ncbi:MAG: chondroitinase-B domain-containing protein, partial [Candidatus Altiarchaeota archaeon]|nr:chondroitinase-B domain-containing protein [Candidatus Altiarchaeota archaeon]
MRRVTLVLLVAYIVVVGFGENVFAAEINVNSIAELNTAIANASAGDTLILADGTYTDQGIINFFAYGTENNPITVRAQTPGGVVFTGSPGYFITMTGEYLILTGFHFQDLSGVGVTISLVDADNCRVTDCYFDNCDQFGGVIEIRGIANNYLSFVGPSTYNQIDHCIFSECENVNIENFIVDVESYPAPDLENIHNKIDHCIFQNTAHSTIQNGRGSSLWGGNRGYVAENAADAYLIVEYSYFTGITAQKSIESKSSSNTYRYNFFENNVPGELSLRGGDDCIVEGNFFYEDGMRNTGLYRGIKISGTGHIIRNNYLEGATSPTYDTHLAIVLQWGQSDLFYQPVSNVLVANNVIRNT